MPVSKLAQAGRFETLKFSASPSGSLAAGVNDQGWPASAAVCGTPWMVGARFAAVPVGAAATPLPEDEPPPHAVSRPSASSSEANGAGRRRHMVAEHNAVARAPADRDITRRADS